MSPAYPPRNDSEDIARRRQRAVQTAKVIAVLAVLIYIGFILTGMFGR